MDAGQVIGHGNLSCLGEGTTTSSSLPINFVSGSKFAIFGPKPYLMHLKLSLFFMFCLGPLFAQENTEIYVFDIAVAPEGIELFNARNVSNNEGYDNQPSFISNEVLVFSGNNKGQTDISEYDFVTQLKTWVNPTPKGSEYSPQKFPSTKNLAAVRLDQDGSQGLYEYNPDTKATSEIIGNLQVAYFAFYDESQMLATVVSNEQMDLVLIDLKTKSVDTLWEHAGRTLQKIPGTETMAYTLVNEDNKLDLYVLDMDSRNSFFICEMPMGIQDFVWMNEYQILTGMGNKLYIYDTLGESEWKKVSSLEEYGITNITRMALSSDGKKLALVVQEI